MRYPIVGLVVMLLAACGGDDSDPENALRDWVARGEQAAEAKDRSGLLEMISEDYADARGNDRARIGDTLRLYFFRQETVALLISIDDIVLYDDTAAKVSLTVGMAGTNDSVLGIRADAYRFELELQKPGDEWMLIGASWGELGSEIH